MQSAVIGIKGRCLIRRHSNVHFCYLWFPLADTIYILRHIFKKLLHYKTMLFLSFIKYALFF